MLIIGEKINGAIPAVNQAIEQRDREVIVSRVRMQAAASDYIDCAAGGGLGSEYEAMCWLIDIIQSETELPICLDSPDAALLARLIREGRVSRPGMINSVSMEGDKCDILLPLAAETGWSIVGLTCDDSGIPSSAEGRIGVARQIIDRAFNAGVAPEKLFIDPCVLSLATCPTAMTDFVYCVNAVHELAPGVRTVGAISNISFGMPARKYVNMSFMTSAVQAGLDAAIMDPASENMMGVLFAAAALDGSDKGGRRYNRAYRRGLFGAKK